VKDGTGAVVPGVRVTAVHLATNTSYTASTTASGDFTVPALPVGNYQMRVEHTGFKTEIANDIVVAAGATVRLDVSLELGATQQTIEVGANAQILQADTARVSTEVSAKVIEKDQPGQPHQGKVFVAVHAHLDDVPYFAGGLCAKLMREGYTGYIVRTPRTPYCTAIVTVLDVMPSMLMPTATAPPAGASIGTWAFTW
jgi:Carboxypeptidase regulatory-like domain